MLLMQISWDFITHNFPMLFLAVLSVFKLFWCILLCVDIKIRKSHKNLKNCFEKPKKSCFCVFVCVLGYLPTQ